MFCYTTIVVYDGAIASPVIRNTITGMELRKHYSQPPIAEAVIDVRVDLPDEVTLETLTRLHSNIEVDYPIRQELLIAHGQMVVGASVEATASQYQIGSGFVSSDQKQSFQARMDGFSFIRLAPYDCWETFRDEAKRLWNIYRSVAKPKAITKLAVRYINRLDLPLPFDDFKDYLRTVPEVSPDLPEGLSGYFMQLQIPQEKLKGMLVLNEAIIPPPKSDVVSVLLDIDLFREIDIPNDEAVIWDFLEQLHNRTDQVFEACITDKMRELIN
ncbi:TIGR04255 family protein [Kamptonema animale CS-326]|uniref:TIGR04255 family protein n=1 Tax=Kamptonema animale TaxID=92934 RepID=UPI0023302596|nr:TIGR04255 family protein [Kamptonema animale]MDB9512341.1 TIGR04255 family protein [Kamptonema animale CS-326]